MLSAGEVIHDRYRVDVLIGKGGMGEVYAAWDLKGDRAVALKTVLRERVGNDKVQARFQQEVELSQRIAHENVLSIFEVFEIERPELEWPMPCMVMEFLDGESLADRLHRDQRFHVDDALPLVCQMASALGASHRAGVVHRDLKPDNVFLVPGEAGTRAVLTDFGVARSAADVKASSGFGEGDSLTATNVILGTPFYMAPEQLELETATPSTDIYTFGLVIYEMVTGTLPFLAQSTLQTVFRRVREDPASPRDHVPDLDSVWEKTILRCLARDPKDRFRQADDICAALGGSTFETGTHQRISTGPQGETADDEGVPTLWMVGVVAAVLALALVIWLVTA